MKTFKGTKEELLEQRNELLEACQDLITLILIHEDNELEKTDAFKKAKRAITKHYENIKTIFII